MADPRDTPAMQQYARFKARHKDCVLLFRIGDFYEMFDDDAVAVSKAIGLTLTQRTAGIPMAGVPYHQLETYLKRLIAQGFRVAVCEQLEDAASAKGVVQRGVTRVITPGTLVDESLVENDAGGTLAAVVFTGSGDDSPAALAFAEVSTGEFVVASARSEGIIDELARRRARELLYAATADGAAPPRVNRLLDALGLSGTPRASWQFRRDEAGEALRGHFGVSTLAGFGLRDDDEAIPAAGAIVRYLLETQTVSDEDLKNLPGASAAGVTLKHLRPPRRDAADSYCVVDAVSLRALEVERVLRGPQGSSQVEGSLLGIFIAPQSGRSLCRTPMGRRLLRDWLVRPIRDLAAITRRQDAVAALVEDRTLASQAGELLDGMQDAARIAGRVALGRAGPRDLAALARSVLTGAKLGELLGATPALGPQREALAAACAACTTLAADIAASLADDPPALIRDGGAFRDGCDAALDEARLLQRDAGSWLSEYQARLVEQHKLPGLRVGFNRVFGYYIELPAAQARQAPPQLTRKQTLKNAERFTTPELREFETKVTSAEARALDRERELFAAMCERVGGVLAPLASFADAAAEIDVLLAFADKAVRRRWVRPRLVEDPTLCIHAGRHPVLDELLGSNFVPNDIELGIEERRRDEEAKRQREEPPGTDSDCDSSAPSPRLSVSPSLALITGPNMAGKSTFIRQTALICLLAHTGSFVPADRATIGLIDRVFTRIGADDALHAGQSTFMVEMVETANILHHASPRSLVILDEIGRGTSTLDGLSLAWAIVEHLAAAAPRTLFATHYHELTDLEERLPGRLMNLHVAVREWPAGDDHAQIVFLHRILPGRADQSYGLHVARLAGIPAPVVARARDVLASLAVQHTSATRPDPASVPPARASDDGQLPLFTVYAPHPAVDALKEIKLDALTPLDAFDELRKLKAMSNETA